MRPCSKRNWLSFSAVFAMVAVMSGPGVTATGTASDSCVGTFGTETVRVPRVRIENEAGKVSEWRSKALPRYRRLTKKAKALIAAVYLAGTNTRRVKGALFGLFAGAVSKDVVSRAWAAR